VTLQSLARFAEAEEHHKEGLAINREALGTDHPSYANHLNNLASVVQARGRIIEARDLYRQ
jgi:tetratricopeptide (TPR) repeat protein